MPSTTFFDVMGAGLLISALLYRRLVRLPRFAPFISNLVPKLKAWAIVVWIGILLYQMVHLSQMEDRADFFSVDRVAGSMDYERYMVGLLADIFAFFWVAKNFLLNTPASRQTKTSDSHSDHATGQAG